MSNIKVPREFSRRCRKLDFSVMKAQEMRNILLFFFNTVIDCFEKEAKERQLWLLLAFSVRACIIPAIEYSETLVPIITQNMQSFYNLYETLFGVRNCTYTVHVISSHLLDMRIDGPLTETSAFDFENFYAELRRSFVPGTPNPLKQIFQNLILKRLLRGHYCNSPIHYSAKDTPLESNSFIYIYENNDHHFYKISEIRPDSQLLCLKMGKYPLSYSEYPNLPWNLVGVYKKGPITNKTRIISPSECHGKALIVGKLILSCPINILEEK